MHALLDRLAAGLLVVDDRGRFRRPGAIACFSALLAVGASAWVALERGPTPGAAPVGVAIVGAWAAVGGVAFALIGRFRGRDAAFRFFGPFVCFSGIAAIVWIVLMVRAADAAGDDMFRYTQQRPPPPRTRAR